MTSLSHLCIEIQLFDGVVSLRRSLHQFTIQSSYTQVKIDISNILTLTYDIKSHLHNQIPLIIRCKFGCIYIINLIIILLRVLMAVNVKGFMFCRLRVSPSGLWNITPRQRSLYNFFIRMQAKRSRSLSATNYIKEQSFIQECIE